MFACTCAPTYDMLFAGQERSSVSRVCEGGKAEATPHHDYHIRELTPGHGMVRDRMGFRCCGMCVMEGFNTCISAMKKCTCTLRSRTTVCSTLLACPCPWTGLDPVRWRTCQCSSLSIEQSCFNQDGAQGEGPTHNTHPQKALPVRLISVESEWAWRHGTAHSIC